MGICVFGNAPLARPLRFTLSFITSQRTMKAYWAVLVLLSILGIGHLSHGFKMTPKVELPPLKDQRVLVIGASGDVGNLVRYSLPGRTE